MIADFGDNILRHGFVAVQAERVLPFLLEWLMALAALPLDVGMPLDHLSGHHECLDRIGAGR